MIEKTASDYFYGDFLYQGIAFQSSKPAPEKPEPDGSYDNPFDPPGHKGFERFDYVQSLRDAGFSLVRRVIGKPEDKAMTGFIWRAADLWESRGEHAGTSTGQCPDSPFQRFLASLLHLLDPAPRLYSGDTLFNRSIGRTDLWGGSYPAILQSIHSHLLVLDGDTPVFPGHGPQTSIGDERLGNPFLQDGPPPAGP